MAESIDLSGQVALVTGGGRGIGRAVAIALAEVGALVAVTARTDAQVDETVRLIQAAGGTAGAFPADVSDPESVERLVGDVTSCLGPVDLVVNNAGLSGPPGRDWEHDSER
ncbi:MAG: SDR family NAD(P)-dependent oxidoreductase, partial [Chloroflexi bacterium]|nr:SDR family NAD(P)-dependent oxidoreductase [Chloroflexota bacterium]